MMNDRNVRGFTLIELMIVLVIIGILTAIAYPSYINQTMSARRADAQGTLVELSQFMERFYTLNNRYDQDLIGNAVTLPVVAGGYYNIALDAVAANAYALEAAPIAGGAQDGDRCGTMTLTNTGATTPDGCW